MPVSPFRAVAIFLSSVVAVAILSGCGDSSPPSHLRSENGSGSSAASEEDAVPADGTEINVSADELYTDISRGETTAHEKYWGHRIVVTGVIRSSISFLEPTPGSSPPAVILAVSREPLKGLYCFLRLKEGEPWAFLAASQKVKIEGVYPEVQSTAAPGLRSCRVVELGSSTAISLSAPELAAAYSDNRQAAIARFQDRGLLVRGEIIGREEPLLGQVIVYLKGSERTQVECRMVRDAAWMTDPLKVGKKVKLYGSFSDGGYRDKAVRLESCLVITLP